jgi:hypothetical protein
VSLRSGRRRLTSRRGLAGVAVGVVAVLAASGCDSDLHPGAAAVVDGTTISQDQVDDVVTAVCDYLMIANESAQTPSEPAFSDLRSSFLGLYVEFEVVDAATEALGLTIHPADIDAFASQFELPDDLSDEDADIIDGYLYEQADDQVSQATIAAHLKDSGVTDSSDVDPNAIDGAADYLADQLSDADIEVNPAYGVWDGQAVTIGSGSLSSLVSKTLPPPPEDGSQPQTDTSDLPPSQVCG